MRASGITPRVGGTLLWMVVAAGCGDTVGAPGNLDAESGADLRSADEDASPGPIDLASTTKPDSSMADAAMLPDLTTNDLSMNDLFMNDLTTSHVMDLAPPANDLTTPPDFTRPVDLTIPPDFTTRVDLTIPPDLTTPMDLAIPPDFKAPVDLTIPPDLTVNPDLLVVCNNQCPMAGAIQCANNAVSTCVADMNGCLSWGSSTACGVLGCLDGTQCNLNECRVWGASCNGAELDTCVYDQEVMYLKLLTQQCALGCNAGACNRCGALDSPVLSAVKNDESAFYGHVVVTGNTAIAGWQERQGIYTGTHDGITSVDVTNPAALAVNTVQNGPLKDHATRLRVVGNRLYYLSATGVQILDVTNPAAPAPLGSYPYLDNAVNKRDLSINGNIACLATDDGLHLLDVSQPNAVKEVGVYTSIFQTPGNVHCTGNYAVMPGGAGIEVADVTDPTRPKFATKLAYAGLLWTDMDFDGSTIYAISESYVGAMNLFWNAVETFRFTAPNTVVHLGKLDYLERVSAIDLAGSSLYVTTLNSLGVIDVTNPAAPLWKKQFLTVPEPNGGVAVANGLAYLSGNGVAALDMARWPDLTVRSVAALDDLGGAATYGSLEFLARAKSGFIIEDLRDPTRPVVLSTTALAGATDVAVRGQNAYVTFATNAAVGMNIYDVRSPWSPQLLGTVGFNLGQFDTQIMRTLSLSGSRAYALCSFDVCVFDVTDPRNPALLTRNKVIANTHNSTLIGQWIGDTYFLPATNALYAVDFTNYNNPVTVGTLVVPGISAPRQFTIGPGGYAMMQVEGPPNTYYVADLRDPKAMQIVASFNYMPTIMLDAYNGPGSGKDTFALRWDGDRVFLSNYFGGTVMYDVSTPAAPKEMAELWTPAPSRRAFVVDRYLTLYTSADNGFPAALGSADVTLPLCK